jgi:hypothetical protein
MNARLYDPALGRFLSPDPFVQSPDFSQSFNRYSYCLNNPLKYTDKDGEFPWLSVAVVAAFIYLHNAYNNRDQTPDANGNKPSNDNFSKWAWNPADWFKDGKPDIVVTVGTNSDGNWNGSLGVGGSGMLGPVFGYDSNKGPGYGYSYNNENSNLYYPSYNYYAPEQAAEKAWNNLTLYAGTGATAVSELYYSKDLGTWMGKNFTVYDQTWGGNQFTGGKRKFAQNFAKPFKWGSNALGAYDMYNSVVDWRRGEISSAEVTGDVIFGSAALYSGFWGGWANFWYNLGKEYGPMTTYLRKQEEARKRRYQPSW